MAVEACEKCRGNGGDFVGHLRHPLVASFDADAAFLGRRRGALGVISRDALSICVLLRILLGCWKQKEFAV